MALTPLQFTKSWENPTDFPTYEESESKVRADLQLLHDETRDYLNNTLLPELERIASDRPVAGEDYFTDEDKAEMVNDVLDALTVYSGETEEVT